jgi:hypothetical protein
MPISMSCIITIVSISILLINLISHASAKSGGTVSYFIGKPESFPIGNIQASSTNLTFPDKFLNPKDKSYYDIVYSRDR